MDIQYDKHIYSQDGKWVIIITLYDTLKKVPWPRLKKHYSGRAALANNSKTEWFLSPANEDNMPQWKTFVQREQREAQTWFCL